MCCEYNNLCKIASIAIILVLIIVITGVIFIITNNGMQEQKNILVAIANPGDNPTLGFTTIRFSENRIVEGTALSHEEGSDEIRINESGIYQISYQLFGQKEGAGSFNFNAVLLVNDQTIEPTFNEGPVLEDVVNNRLTLTSTVILRLEAGDILKLQGVSIEDILYNRARIDIEKIA